MLKLQNIFALSPFLKTVQVIFLFACSVIIDVSHLNPVVYPVEVTHLKFKKFKITFDRARPAVSPIFQSMLLKIACWLKLHVQHKYIMLCWHWRPHVALGNKVYKSTLQNVKQFFQNS